jgi:hypothetical protein
VQTKKNVSQMLPMRSANNSERTGIDSAAASEKEISDKKE